MVISVFILATWSLLGLYVYMQLLQYVMYTTVVINTVWGGEVALLNYAALSYQEVHFIGQGGALHRSGRCTS